MEESSILRVIAGEARGHKLKTVKGMNTRPTSDRVKEALFNILAPYLTGAEVLDLFGGTGSLGIEALSRGASSAVFCDSSRESIAVITENLARTKLSGLAEVIKGDFAEAIERLSRKGRKFNIILLDPPYNKNFLQETLNIMMTNDIIKDNGIVACERSADDEIPEACGKLRLGKDYRYGDTILSFYFSNG